MTKAEGYVKTKINYGADTCKDSKARLKIQEFSTKYVFSLS